MPRIKLRARLLYSFQYNTTIKIRDINYGNHLGNDAVVGLLHEARIDMFSKIGCSELDLGGHKIGIVVADLIVNYKKQGYLGDEIIIHLHIDEVERSGFRIFYLIERDGEIIALAETGIVVYDYLKEKIAKVPEVFLNALAIWKKTSADRPFNDALE